MDPQSILRFHIFWNLPILFKLFEGFNIHKLCFHVKMDFWNCLYTFTLHRFPNFNKSHFLKINFSSIYHDIFNEITVSRECNVKFQQFSHQNWAIRTVKCSGNSNKLILNFWPNWSLLMCWCYYYGDMIACSCETFCASSGTFNISASFVPQLFFSWTSRELHNAYMQNISCWFAWQNNSQICAK